MAMTFAIGIMAVAEGDRVAPNPSDSTRPGARAVAPWADNGMTANGSAFPEESPFFNAPAVVGTFSIDTSRPGSEAITHFTSDNTGLRSFSPRTTAASISAKKALEFTLIGAKPSGTS